MDIYEAILEKITKPNMIHNYESKFN